MAMEHHHTIENPDVVQILQAEAETYDKVSREMNLIGTSSFFTDLFVIVMDTNLVIS